MTPVTPSPAATLVLLRDRSAAIEVLMIQRHARSKFAAGDFVFAGGKVEPDDIPDDVERFCRDLTADRAAARLGGSISGRDALGYWVGAIREAFEEVGLLLAYAPDGEFVTFTPDNRERFEQYRAACQVANEAFFAMLRAEQLILATDRLSYFAHWITPEENPIRFDTRFFASVAPDRQQPVVDGHEIVDLKWLTAAGALEAMRRKEISLRTPTMKNLEILAEECAREGVTAADVVAAVGRRPVSAIRPRVLTVEGRPVPVLPGDPRWY